LAFLLDPLSNLYHAQTDNTVSPTIRICCIYNVAFKIVKFYFTIETIERSIERKK